MTDVIDTTWLDATAQADLVRRGELTPKDLVEAAIARIEAVNPQLDAVLRTRFDQARTEALSTYLARTPRSIRITARAY